MFGHLTTTMGAFHVGPALAGIVTAIGLVLIGRYRHLAAANPARRDPPKAAMATDIP